MRYALGSGLLLLSFFQNFSTAPWPAAHHEIFAFLAVLAWGWGAVLGGPLVLCYSNISFVALSLLALVGIQYLHGMLIFGGDAFVLMLYVQLCWVTLLIGQRFTQDIQGPVVLARVLLAAALCSAVIALAQGLWVGRESDWILSTAGYRRPGANFGQPNHLATLLVMGAASLIYLDHRFKISRAVLLLCSLLIALGMGITESRTGLGSGLALALWWFWHRETFAPRAQVLWVVASATALIAAMWLWPPTIRTIQEAGLPAPGLGLNLTPGTRFLMWQQLWEAVQMHPWWGWGLRGTSVALQAVLESHPTLVSEPFTYAHNLILEMAIGMGIPLTALAVLALVQWVVRRMRLVRTPDSWFAMAVLIPFGIHCMLEYPFAYAYLLVPALLAAGMLTGNGGTATKRPISRVISMGFLLMFSGLLAWIAWDYVAAEEDFQVARFESLGVGATPTDYAPPATLLLTQLAALNTVARWAPHPGLSPQDLALTRAVAIRFPWVTNQNRYALVLALNDDPQGASRQLAVLRAMHGESSYQVIRAKWQSLASTHYPQLGAVVMP